MCVCGFGNLPCIQLGPLQAALVNQLVEELPHVFSGHVTTLQSGLHSYPHKYSQLGYLLQLLDTLYCLLRLNIHTHKHQ